MMNTFKQYNVESINTLFNREKLNSHFFPESTFSRKSFASHKPTIEENLSETELLEESMDENDTDWGEESLPELKYSPDTKFVQEGNTTPRRKEIQYVAPEVGEIIEFLVDNINASIPHRFKVGNKWCLKISVKINS